MKLAIIGPAQSGKTVFVDSLLKMLPEGARKIHAAPDGEGDWSQDTDQEIAKHLREKQKFSGSFVDRTLQEIRTFQDKLGLINTGGVKDAKDIPLILQESDGVIVLSREDQADEWEGIARRSGKPVFAVIRTRRLGEAEPVIDDIVGTIRGRLVGLDRGKIGTGPVMDEVVGKLRAIMADTTDGNGERAEALAKADVIFDAIATEFGIPRHAEGGRAIWRASDLQRLAETIAESATKESVHLYGTAPNMVWLAAVSGAKPAQSLMYDPKGGRGYVEIHPLVEGKNDPSGLLWRAEEWDTYSVLKCEIPGTHFGDRKLEDIRIPAVPHNKGVVLSGGLPWWFVGCAQETYADTPYFAITQPQEAATEVKPGVSWAQEHPGCTPAVITHSNDPSFPIGTVIAVENDRVRRVERPA